MGRSKNIWTFFLFYMNIHYLNFKEHLSHGETAQNQRSADSLSEVVHTECNDVMNHLFEDCENPSAVSYKLNNLASDDEMPPKHFVRNRKKFALPEDWMNEYTKAYLEDEIPRHHREKADYDFPNGGMENNDLFFNLTLAERTHQLEEAQQRNKSLMQGINALNSAIKRLRRELNMAKKAVPEGVCIEAFREMFLGIKDYEKAKQLFMEINYYLSKDPTWIKYKDEIRSIIEEKKNSNRAPQNVTVNGDLVYTKNVENEVNGVGGKNSVGIKFRKG